MDHENETNKQKHYYSGQSVIILQVDNTAETSNILSWLRNKPIVSETISQIIKVITL